MKKLLALLLASTLVIGAFTACNRNKPEPVEISSSQETNYVYTNGDYSVRYSVPAQDRTLDSLTVSIVDDVISIKDYVMKEMEEPSAASSEAGSDASSPASSEASSAAAAGDASSGVTTEHEVSAAEYAKDILAEYDAAGDVNKMEIIEGAEEHSYRFIRMMRTVLERAKAGDTAPVTLGRYADGSYESTMPDTNADGWKEYLKLTVKDGEIAGLDYNAMKGDNAAELITADEALNKGENKPSEYYPQIPKNFSEAGDDLAKITSPVGGVDATKSFIKLMRPLLNSMVSGGDLKITASRYVDGTYKAQFKDFDETDWKEYVVLEIKQGVVTVKEFDAASKIDETVLKSADTELASKMEEKTGINFTKAVESLIASFGGANNDVTKVDSVAGATVSSNSFKLLVGQILATTAQEGDSKEPLEIDRFAPAAK